MTDLQLATQLNGGYRPMSFKHYEDGHMVIITHQGKKITIAGEIVKKVGQSLKEKTPAGTRQSVPERVPAPASRAHEPAQASPARRASPAPPASSSTGGKDKPVSKSKSGSTKGK